MTRAAALDLDQRLGAGAARNDLVVAGDQRWSTGEIDEAAARLAGGLEEAGVAPGAVVAFQLPIGPQTVIVYRACWRLGAVAAALHHLAGATPLAASVRQLAPVALISAAPLPLAEYPDVVIVGDARWVDLMSGPPKAKGPALDASARSAVLFTSGSTGTPKGVVHTHGSLVSKIEDSISVHALTPADAVLMPAPLAHVSGLLHGVLLPGAVGMKVVLMERWDPGRALEVIERERITYMVGPPTFFTAMMEHPSFSPYRVESIRLLSCGGSGVTPSFVRRTAAAFGAMVKRAYGSTEAPTVATTSCDDDPEAMATTDGRATGATELRVDATAGEVGELWVRGPELAAGYLDADETAAAFVDGWFRTGDVARLDDGWLTVVGRLDDGIIRGGENISAAEVEQVLEAHPAVRQAVAVGQPDPHLGERVAAFVVAPDGFDLATCRDWFATQGASRLIVPERIEVLAELPTLASGKPDRQTLRRLL